MISNIYQRQEELISTAISGKRSHYTYRQPERATETYRYELSYGQNYHTLSASIFGTDELWWVLDDINPPKDVFSLGVGDTVTLPGDLIKQQRDLKRIF